jgi:hypothetical protein
LYTPTLLAHPIHDNQTYNDYIGSKTLRREGAKKWSHRVRKTIKILNSLLHYDVLYLGAAVARQDRATEIIKDGARRCDRPSEIDHGRDF